MNSSSAYNIDAYDIDHAAVATPPGVTYPVRLGSRRFMPAPVATVSQLTPPVPPAADAFAALLKLNIRHG